MKLPHPSCVGALLRAGAIALSCVAAAHAQDAAAVNSHTVKVVVDNAQVRVLEATIPPGEKENPHSHPASVIYVIDGGQVRNHVGDQVSETTLVSGRTLYREPTTHWAENVGDTTIHLILVELKEQP